MPPLHYAPIPNTQPSLPDHLAPFLADIRREEIEQNKERFWAAVDKTHDAIETAADWSWERTKKVARKIGAYASKHARGLTGGASAVGMLAATAAAAYIAKNMTFFDNVCAVTDHLTEQETDTPLRQVDNTRLYIIGYASIIFSGAIHFLYEATRPFVDSDRDLRNLGQLSVLDEMLTRGDQVYAYQKAARARLVPLN